MEENDFALPNNPYAPVYLGGSLHWHFQKGEVDNEGEVLHACDERFLIEILLKMGRAYEDVFKFIFKHSTGGPGSQPTSEDLELIREDIILAINEATFVLVKIAKDIRRLQRYPDLYPKKAAMDRFHTALESKLRTQHESTVLAAEMMRNEECWKRFHQAERLIDLWLRRPTFHPNLKPWQQFLVDGAPGSGMNPKLKFLGKVLESDDHESSTVDESSTFQVLPPGALALWDDLRDEYEEIKRKCKETKIPEHLLKAHEPSSEFISPLKFRRETIPFEIEKGLWMSDQPSEPSIFPRDNLPQLSEMIGAVRDDNIIPGDEDLDDMVPGMIVASHPNNESSTLHHEVDP